MKAMKIDDPLHILLTNDDGHEAPGIKALQQVFKRAGHRVSMVAPSTQQSATSMAVTSRRKLVLNQIGQDSWHLDGQPADTVLVALRHLFEDNPPDLVLSGINFGPNVGTAVYMSGTIGAAIMASLHGVPAIAISAGMRFDEAGSEFPSTFEILDPAAEFVSSVVASLRSTADKNGRLLPKNIMLNINYPALPREQIKGILQPEVSTGHLIEMGYHRGEETGQVIPGFFAGVDPRHPDRQDHDVRAHMEGYITISAIKPHWNPPASQTEQLQRRLNTLKTEFSLV